METTSDPLAPLSGFLEYGRESISERDVLHLQEAEAATSLGRKSTLEISQEELPDPESASKRGENPPLKEKLSVWGVIVFSVGPTLMLAGMALLSFLWFANENSQTWKDIMLRNWLTKAVAISAEVVKQAMVFQTAIVVAMLASLALERSETPLPHVASFTVMRATAGSGTILLLLWNYIVGFRYAGFRLSLVFIMVILTGVVFGLTQAISILLLSDIDLRNIPGLAAAVTTPFAFSELYNSTDSRQNHLRVIEREGTWFSKPSVYPAFAEYSEPQYKAEGVGDTGPTLRAFLPLRANQDRQTLKSYSGFTIVMDSRVTCQLPALINPRVQILSRMTELLLFEGAVRASRSTPRLGNATMTYKDKGRVFDVSIPFSCLAPPGPVTAPSTTPSDDGADEWRLAICQLPNGQGVDSNLYAGGLVGEFDDFSTWWNDMADYQVRSDNGRHGTAYLIVNVIGGSQGAWKAIVEDDVRGRGYQAPAYSHRNEWLDLVFSNGSMVLSTTLCYSAFRFANVQVNITSSTNRTEPEPIFDPSLKRYTFDDVRKQFGQDRSLSLQDRGLLRLKKQSWLIPPNRPAEHFMRYFADLGRSTSPKGKPNGNYGNASGLMDTFTNCPSPFGNGTLQVIDDLCATPEIMHRWLMQEILRTGGTIAFALQTMFTLLSASAYYDQIGQFDNSSVVEQTFFVVANVPVSIRGFIVVAVTVAAHLVLSAVAVVLFLRDTKFSRIGAVWSALGQTIAGDGERYIKEASMYTDGQVEDLMKLDGVRGTRAGLRLQDGQVQVVLRRSPP